MADPALVAHCRACTNSKCSCRTFFKNFDRWAEKLPLHPIIPEETWLWFKFLGQGHDQFISWSCVACEASPHASGHFTSKFARSASRKESYPQVAPEFRSGPHGSNKIFVRVSSARWKNARVSNFWASLARTEILVRARGPRIFRSVRHLFSSLRRHPNNMFRRLVGKLRL